jgi:uncharacterized repeat protein (TIGR01451 family)
MNITGPLTRAIHNLAKRDARWIAAMICAVFWVFSGQSAIAQTAQYTNTTAGVIRDVDCGTAGQVTRDFTVPAGIVTDVNLGVLYTHTYRSDVRITLRSPPTATVPAGITVAVMTNTAGAGDNLNDLFDDEAAALISTHNATVTDPTAPILPNYSHSFRPTAPLSAFDGQNAGGTWRLIVCDSVGTDTGNFVRADLFITTNNLNVTKTSSVISDGVSGANPKSVPGAIVRYCILSTNPSPIAFTNIISNDVIPATETYVAGSIRSGTTCAGATTVEDDDNAGADEADPFGASITGATVRGSAPSVAAGTSFALVFNATIN